MREQEIRHSRDTLLSLQNLFEPPVDAQTCTRRNPVSLNGYTMIYSAKSLWFWTVPLSPGAHPATSFATMMIANIYSRDKRLL